MATAPTEKRRPLEIPPRASPPEAEGTRCDICGSVMEEVHCRLFCRNCGYTRDCSDP